MKQQDLKKAWLPSNRAFFVFALLLWLSGSVQAACDLSTQALQKLPRLAVQRVIDGDSLLLKNGEQLRLIGVNTPEMKTSQPLAAEARAYLQQLLQYGAPLYWQPGEQQRDRYGRLLGHLFLSDGRNVEALLLQQGLGFLVAIPPNLSLLDCHIQRRDRARSAKRGVWMAGLYPVKTPAQLTPEDAGFQRVQGRLQQVSLQGKNWWLQLDGPVVLRVSAMDQPYFNAKVIQMLLGKQLTASGWLVHRHKKQGKYSPYMLLLTHPKLLEVND